MNLNKKAISVSWHVIILGIALLVLAYFLIIIVFQTEDPLVHYIDKITDTIFT